jgi:hypothetical protein
MLVGFDYELAKLAINCKTGRVVTKDGRLVELIGTDLDDKEYPIVGRIEGLHGNNCWTENGKFLSYKDTDFDLFIEELC